MERNLIGAILYLATAPAGATFSQRSLRKSLHCYMGIGGSFEGQTQFSVGTGHQEQPDPAEQGISNVSDKQGQSKDNQ